MNNHRVAIIGSGISGLTAAHFLSEKYKVKIFEKDEQLGGNSKEIEINYDGRIINVDTSHTSFNQKSSPNLSAFFDFLKVSLEKSEISFGIKISDIDLEYSLSGLFGLFAQKKNLKKSDFWQMIFEISRFNKTAYKLLNQTFDGNYSIIKFLEDSRYSEMFRDCYLLPIAATIWQTSLQDIASYPAASLIQFFYDHGLLRKFYKLNWSKVSGGSSVYIKKIADGLGSNAISTNNAVKSVFKNEAGVLVVSSETGNEEFDYVIIATHCNQALKILTNPNKEQKEALEGIKYQKNFIVLHKDISLMPQSKGAWASCVYLRGNKNSLSPSPSITYWLNNLQNINKDYPLFISINPETKINPSDIFACIDYENPILNSKINSAQQKIQQIQGKDGIYFCGAYQNLGSQEDGIVSALKVVNALGCKALWQK